MQISQPLGVYVSIPFCRSKCSYCNFASGVFGAERMGRYVDRLTAEIHAASDNTLGGLPNLPDGADTIYFGGGTPSLLSTEQMRQIVTALQQVFRLTPRAEMTLECAPGQLNDALLYTLPELGFRRVSLGVQSFTDEEAAAVGRLHTRASTLKEIERLRAVGIENINVDLIAGLPLQTAESWRYSVEQVIATGVPHVSVYMLDVDEDSRLGREILAEGVRYRAQEVPDERAIAAMYGEACERLGSAGIPQYEISNFARPGWESQHNLKYWTRQPYVGFGLDAHSFLNAGNGGAIRIATTDDLDAYLTDGAQQEATPVSRDGAIEEAWFLGLRLNAGVSLAQMEAAIGWHTLRYFQPIIADCEQQGLLEQDGGNVRLTGLGRLFANDVFARFLGVATGVQMETPEKAIA